MSRAIADSISLLSETLGNCKTNLKEKEVADVDNIKISDVDEKIAEIQSGGGGVDLNNLDPSFFTSVKFNGTPVNFGEMKKYNSTRNCTIEVEFNGEKEVESIILINNYNVTEVESFEQQSNSKVTFNQVRCDSPMTKSAILIYRNDPTDMNSYKAFLFFVSNRYL